MVRKTLLSLLTVGFISFSFAQQANPFLAPERVNPRINVAVQIAKDLKAKNYNRIAVVYMETSDLCALFAGALVASLKTLGVDAYYIKGGEGLEERLMRANPSYIYMAYFGDRPHEEVQNQFNADLRRVLTYAPNMTVILQPSLVALGFLSGVYSDERLAREVEGKKMLSYIVEQGKVFPVVVEFKDLEVRVERQKEQPKKPQRKR